MAKWIRREHRYAHYMAEGWDPMTGRGLHCALCGCEVIVGAHNKNPLAATLDHMEARAVSGRRYDRRIDNLVVSCAKCNGDRKEMDLDAWLASIGNRYAEVVKDEIARRMDAKITNWKQWVAASFAAGFANRK